MMRGTDEIVAVAEELLSKRFGGTQSLTDIEKLGGSGTAIVLRARVAPSPFLQQRSVVLKYTPATNDSMDDAALIREVVSYQFTTSLPKDVRPGPVLLAYDIDSRLLVISDSGEGETFADLLNYSGPEQRLQLLRNLGQSIGRMHAGTADREQHFDILLTRMLSRYPDTAELHEMRDASLLVSIDNGIELLSNAVPRLRMGRIPGLYLRCRLRCRGIPTIPVPAHYYGCRGRRLHRILGAGSQRNLAQRQQPCSPPSAHRHRTHRLGIGKHLLPLLRIHEPAGLRAGKPPRLRLRHTRRSHRSPGNCQHRPLRRHALQPKPRFHRR